MKLLLAVNAGLFVLSAALFIALFAPAPLPQLAAQGLLDDAAQDDRSATEEIEREHENGDSEEATEAEDAVNDEEETAVLYEYVAQPGDSYTKMARKAAQTYGLKFDVSLSAAQIIFVETNLTQVAGSPLLNLGEEVTISEATVKQWVEAAQELSEAEEAVWATYASGVDFNTDNVGE